MTKNLRMQVRKEELHIDRSWSTSPSQNDFGKGEIHRMHKVEHDI